MIGHIKTSLEIQDTEVFSVTLDKADCRKGSFSRMEGKLAAIVFFVRPKTIEKFVRRCWKISRRQWSLENRENTEKLRRILRRNWYYGMWKIYADSCKS